MAQYQEFDGRVALVTGGGSNLGRCIAQALAAQGAVAVICDVNADAAAETVRLIREVRGAARPITVNVSNASQVEALVSDVMANESRIDILINCAGITQVGRPATADVSEELFDRIIAVNLKGVWLGMKYVIPAMIRGGGGAIVNIASVMGLVADAGVGIYAASKHGVLALTKAAALEYGREGVRINAVCPGRQEGAMINPNTPDAARTRAPQQNGDMNPASGRLGRADEVAATVLFLCSDGASNIHGSAIPVDGGYTAR
jgi:NAD(P)-dependent dehydrogenase (short-subunit alcohol dehydrogenase family)